MADPADIKAYAEPKARVAGLDWPTYERQIQQESGWTHWSSPGVVKSSPTGSKGLGQLNSHFYPESDWADPYTNISKSIEIMVGYLKKFGSYRKALAAYNWGPGNVGGYTKTDGTVVPPWNGSRGSISAQGAHYLDVILGPDWSEPGGATMPTPAPVTDPWNRTQLISAGFSTPAEWPISAPRPIQAIVWHDMEGHLAGAIATWNQGAAGAHLCVLEDGTIVRTVLIENIAWHAGTNNDPSGGVYGRTPFWRSHNINPYSIGVELEGFVASGYTPSQVDACVKIGAWAQAKYGIAPVHTIDQIAGHHMHSELSSSRSDPGPKFPFDQILQRIAQGGATMPDEPAYFEPGQVGTGILEMMAEDGTQPSMPSVFLPLGSSPAVGEECTGLNGTKYLFHIPTGRRWRYPAA
jgi:hypothetical protein